MITKTLPASYHHWLQLGRSALYDIRDFPICIAAEQCNPGTWKSVRVPGETITYENSNKRKFNYCKHIHDRFNWLHNAPRANPPPLSGYQYHYRITAGHDENLYPRRPDAPYEYTVTEGMRKRAWNAMYPRLNTGTNMMLFLLELTDIPRLVLTARKLFKTSMRLIFGKDPKFPRNLNEYQGLKKFLHSLHGMSKTLAELHLSNEFGIKPFVKEFQKLADDVIRTDKLVNAFIANGRKARSYHYMEDLGSSKTGIQQYRTEAIFAYAEGKYFATLRCKYLYRKPSGLSGWMKVMGLRLTPETIWEKVHFSFVLDWVFDLSMILEQLDRDPYLLTVEVLDYCDTIKSVEKRVCHVNSKVGSNHNFVHCPDMVDAWSWARTYYVRVPSEPNTGFAFPVFDYPSKTQLVLASALAIVHT